MLSVSIITPVWNMAELTDRFLAQHWAYFAGRDGVEWVIINNGSTDQTGQVLDLWERSFGDKLKRVDLAENAGFGPGNNRGAEIATGDILIFLSNDVQVIGDYITPAIDAISDDKGALYGPQIFSHDTGWNNFNATGPIPYVAGWCVIAHRELWAKVGPWDERFVPCDYEDMDLSFMAQKMGYPLVKLDLPLKHDSGKSAEKLPGGRLQVTLQNRERFRQKWGV